VNQNLNFVMKSHGRRRYQGVLGFNFVEFLFGLLLKPFVSNLGSEQQMSARTRV